MCAQVLVRKMDSRTVMIAVDSLTTAGDLIRKVIESDRTINQEDVQLVYNGTPLEEDEKILEYVEGDVNTIDLVYIHHGGEN